MRVFEYIRDLLLIPALLILAGGCLCLILRLDAAVVLSDSMKPTFSAGSLAIVDMKQAETVTVGDVAAFYIGDRYITHRIVEDSGSSLITKGDANSCRDSWKVKRGAVVGKTIFAIPFAGYVFNAVSSKRGMIIATGIIICLCLSGHRIRSGHAEEAGHD